MMILLIFCGLVKLIASYRSRVKRNCIKDIGGNCMHTFLLEKFIIHVEFLAEGAHCTLRFEMRFVSVQ